MRENLESFLIRYAPKTPDELLLPPIERNQVAAFIEKPAAGLWVIHGDMGLGKTQAAIMMGHAASEDILEIDREDATEIANRRYVSSKRSTMDSGLWVYMLNDAETTTPEVMEHLVLVAKDPGKAVWLLTTDQPEKLPAELLDNAHQIHFSKRGLSKMAVPRLSQIAALEGHSLSKEEALSLLRKSKNNMRVAVSKLEDKLEDHFPSPPSTSPEQTVR